ncbi:MAG TPA: helix-turn-helix domain-containing protein, partial [Acidimicrobiales bacterium]|nr:helix-turn-helix domain-containing protein [Acidimicrobiales bacterium]
MTNESGTASSTSILQAVDAQRALSLGIKVREAAKRLRVSISTVYRLDREHGPIRFLSKTRPITIDPVSLENHGAITKSIELGPELVTDGVPCPCPYEEQTEQTESGTSEMSVEATQSALPRRPSP